MGGFERKERNEVSKSVGPWSGETWSCALRYSRISRQLQGLTGQSHQLPLAQWGREEAVCPRISGLWNFSALQPQGSPKPGNTVVLQAGRSPSRLHSPFCCLWGLQAWLASPPHGILPATVCSPVLFATADRFASFFPTQFRKRKVLLGSFITPKCKRGRKFFQRSPK